MSLSLYNKTAYYVDSPTNVSFHASNVPFMICPSDSFASSPYNGTILGSGLSTWGRGDYAANAVVDVYASEVVAVLRPQFALLDQPGVGARRDAVQCGVQHEASYRRHEQNGGRD